MRAEPCWWCPGWSSWCCRLSRRPGPGPRADPARCRQGLIELPLVRPRAGHPDLYDAIRRGQARQAPQGPALRLYALAAAVAALPLALAGTLAEVATRTGGTIYLQARRQG